MKLAAQLAEFDTLVGFACEQFAHLTSAWWLKHRFGCVGLLQSAVRAEPVDAIPALVPAAAAVHAACSSAAATIMGKKPARG